MSNEGAEYACDTKVKSGEHREELLNEPAQLMNGQHEDKSGI